MREHERDGDSYQRQNRQHWRTINHQQNHEHEQYCSRHEHAVTLRKYRNRIRDNSCRPRHVCGIWKCLPQRIDVVAETVIRSVTGDGHHDHLCLFIGAYRRLGVCWNAFGREPLTQCADRCAKTFDFSAESLHRFERLFGFILASLYGDDCGQRIRICKSRFLCLAGNYLDLTSFPFL